ncbi:tumor necrosis factor receptor superfamily member 23 [Melanotaenia boesemani]|uniref:tumor necrosis factor receptor superfamily member 23 n=1 Tax=Melanotaenia boesemani TaxID=1250792 RepID=UPI001C03E6E2|nr:tumor necrosis factor receptor superfamily member 23 [Melanotaenia boesemani]
MRRRTQTGNSCVTSAFQGIARQLSKKPCTSTNTNLNFCVTQTRGRQCVCRGSLLTSRVIFSSTMRPLYYFTFSLLCSLSLLSSGITLKCNDMQYPWPLQHSKFCCDKCPPGQYMVRRPEDKCGTQCEPCIGDRFIHTYNVEQDCSVCDTCSKLYMELKSSCNATHNTQCKCKAGFKCSDESCTNCEPMPTTIKPILPPSTTASKIGNLTTPKPTPEPVKDSVWFLVIVALLCLGIALVMVTKIKPFLFWIRFNHGYFLTEKCAEAPCAEVVSQPVQEVCGKCDQRIDV